LCRAQVVDGRELKRRKGTFVEILKIEFFVGVGLVNTTAHEAGIVPFSRLALQDCLLQSRTKDTNEAIND
jgi:hypothetical protein